MEAGIVELANTLVEEHAAPTLDEGRRNELRIAITLSLNAIANRVDRSYHIDVRAGLPPEEDSGEDDEAGPTEDPATVAAREAVLARQEGLRYMNLTGSPILELPEGSPEDED
jgi:hypothetical protein